MLDELHKPREVILYDWYDNIIRIPPREKLIKIMRESNRIYAHTDKGVHTLIPCHKCKQIKDYKQFSSGTSPCNKCHSDILEAFYESKDAPKTKRRKANRCENIPVVPMPPGGNDTFGIGHAYCGRPYRKRKA